MEAQITLQSLQSLLQRPLVWRLNLSGFLALAGILGPVVFLITDLLAGLSTPFYNYSRHSISSLAWSDFGWLQTIGFLTIGLLIELFVAGLYFGLKGNRRYDLGLGLMMLFGFGLLLVGAFHTDPYVGPHSLEGNIHLTSAKIVFWLLPLAGLLMTSSLKKHPHWKSLFMYTWISSIFAILFMISSLIWMQDDFIWFGLFERILVGVEIAWILVMAVLLLRFSLKNTRSYFEPLKTS
jgi:hypothetical membrane protein